MTQPPQESVSAAEVTFAHRLATAETLRSTGNHVAVVNWIQTGVANEFLDENLSAVAQALADAEARGRASRDAELERVRGDAWDAGWVSGYALGLGSANDGGQAYRSYSRHTNPHRKAKTP